MKTQQIMFIFTNEMHTQSVLQQEGTNNHLYRKLTIQSIFVKPGERLAFYHYQFQPLEGNVSLNVFLVRRLNKQPSRTAFCVIVTTCNLLIRVHQHDFPLFFVSDRTI